MMNGYGYGGGMPFGFGVAEVLFLVFASLVVAGIIVLIIWAVRGSHGHSVATSGPGQGTVAPVGHDEAVAIARRRLATGEITKEQFGEIMTALGG